MIAIKEVGTVSVTPKQAWYFLTHTTHSSYLAWQPDDHLDFRVLKQANNDTGLGEKVYYKERIGKRVLRLRCVISQSIPEKYVEFKATGILGLLKLGSGYFRIIPEVSGTKFEAVVVIGWRIPIIDPFIHLFLDVPALRVHMKSEARNIADAVNVLENVLDSEAYTSR